MDTLLVSLVYYNFDIIQKHIESILPINDRVDIVVLENMSSCTEKSKSYFLNLLKQGLIRRYILFDNNIGGHAFTIYFNDILKDISQYNYIVTRDGDLIVSANEWLEEAKKIVQIEDCFCVASKLTEKNLPVDVWPEAVNWILKPIDHGWYLEGYTGGGFLMYKKETFQSLLQWLNNGKIYWDEHLREYCQLTKKRWLVTKEQEAYHLTWDLYKDKNHPYTLLKSDLNRDYLLLDVSRSYRIY